MAVQYQPVTFDGAYVYPDWAVSLGWAVAAVPVAFIPAGAVVAWCTHGGWQVTMNSGHIYSARVLQ